MAEPGGCVSGARTPAADAGAPTPMLSRLDAMLPAARALPSAVPLVSACDGGVPSPPEGTRLPCPVSPVARPAGGVVDGAALGANRSADVRGGAGGIASSIARPLALRPREGGGNGIPSNRGVPPGVWAAVPALVLAPN